MDRIVHDPRRLDGEFTKLFYDIRKCKDDRKCPQLISRRFYFEPNPDTIKKWEKEGIYCKDIDRSVMFVCEGPGKKPTVTENNSATLQCWNNTPQDIVFKEARSKYKFSNCYITNTVKCGYKKGKKHSKDEIVSCMEFLVKEIELVNPLVVVGVG